MQKYHINERGDAKPCHAKIACPLTSEANHESFATPVEAQAWAEQEVARSYEVFGAPKQEQFEKAKARFEQVSAQLDAVAAEMDQDWQRGASQYDVAMIEKCLRYYGLYQEKELAAITANLSSSALRGRKLKYAGEPGRLSNIKQEIADLEEALEIRKDLASMNEVNRKWAVRRLQEILPPSKAVSNRIEDAPASDPRSPAQRANPAAIYDARIDRRVGGVLRHDANEHWDRVLDQEVQDTLARAVPLMDEHNYRAVLHTFEDLSRTRHAALAQQHHAALANRLQQLGLS